MAQHCYTHGAHRKMRFVNRSLELQLKPHFVGAFQVHHEWQLCLLSRSVRQYGPLPFLAGLGPERQV